MWGCRKEATAGSGGRHREYHSVKDIDRPPMNHRYFQILTLFIGVHIDNNTVCNVWHYTIFFCNESILISLFRLYIQIQTHIYTHTHTSVGIYIHNIHTHTHIYIYIIYIYIATTRPVGWAP